MTLIRDRDEHARPRAFVSVFQSGNAFQPVLDFNLRKEAWEHPVVEIDGEPCIRQPIRSQLACELDLIVAHRVRSQRYAGTAEAVSDSPFVDAVLRSDLAGLHPSLVVRDDSGVCDLAEPLRAPGYRSGLLWP